RGFEGIAGFISRHYEENPSAPIKRWADGFMNKITCPSCNGHRLRQESYYFRIGDKHIGEIVELDMSDLNQWVLSLDSLLNDSQKVIGREIIKEIKDRVGFILQVGLD